MEPDKNIPDLELPAILWELCKRLKSHHTSKCYMHKPESTQEYKRHKILQNFEIETDHLNPTIRSDFVLINKKIRIWNQADFTVRED